MTSAQGVPLAGDGTDPGTNYEALITKDLLAGRSNQAPGAGTTNAAAPARRVSAAAVDALTASGRLNLAIQTAGK